MSDFEVAKQAKTMHAAAMLTKPNVVGVGIGYRRERGEPTGELCVSVLVRQKMPTAGLSSAALVPRDLDGVRTDVIQVGELRPLQSRTERWRPAPGGVSLGHYQITAGTFGTVVRDRDSGARLILSNNHVLANSNSAAPGDPILQPGSADGGRVDSDTIARLERFCPIQFAGDPSTCSIANFYVDAGNAIAKLLGSRHRLSAMQVNPQASNLVDAAVARPVDDSQVLEEILEIGAVTATRAAELGMTVRKSGRTTALTSGQITVLDATVTISYGSGRDATFEGQIVTSAMSSGGDSGSLLVAGEALEAVGLLFAGSDQAAIHNPIQAVLDCLNVTIAAPLASKSMTAPTPTEKAQAVKAIYQEQLLAKPNVVGVGVGMQTRGGQQTGQVGLVVLVSQKMPLASLKAEEVIPREIEGVPVDVKEVGELKAQ